MIQNNIKDIRNCSICLYSEKFGELKPYGSGLLVYYNESYYLVTAYHVMDREEEQLEIENDPDEYYIPQDDIDSFYIKINNAYILINESATGIVSSVRYDEENDQPVVDKDTEFCICHLNISIIQILLNSEYRFYPITTPFFPILYSESKAILSGFPRYAQKSIREAFRTYESTLIHSDQLHNSLFRVRFNNFKAYNLELQGEVRIPSEGIKGMSGGGIWYKMGNTFIPIGIIIKQDSQEIIGYRLDWILKFIDTDYDNIPSDNLF